MGKGALGNEKTGKMYHQGGDKKKLVEIAQMMLKELGHDLGTSGPNGDGVDGHFGDSTENAVKQFQEEHKDWDGNALKVDGLVGSDTADALNREMVGKWYKHYQTHTELVPGEPHHTVMSEFLRKGLSVGPCKKQMAKIFIVGQMRIRLHNAFSDPMTNVKYRLYIGDTLQEGTSKDGFVVADYPSDRCVEFKVEWGEPDEGGNYLYHLNLAINCDEGTEKEQAVAKLHNIGYKMENKYEDNVRAFQQDYKIEGEGGLLDGEKLPPNTKRELWDIYGIREGNASRRKQTA